MQSLRSKLGNLSSENPRRSPSLKQSLDRLYRRQNRYKYFADDSFHRQKRGMHEFVEGDYVNTPFGDIFIGKVRYAKAHQHGNVSLFSVTHISDDWLSRWGRFPTRKRFNHRRTVFVDAETSGLAGGGGTLAFLIGLGYYYRNEFRVEQFFADSHSREEGMLDLVADFLQPFDTLVTFNGKAFDIPLLETRFLLKRKQNPFHGLAHLDLLHPCRQLWNYTLDNCRLQTLEKQILDFHRDDDLSGNEIPAAYFNYLRWGNPDPLYRVFEHNAYDIATLAALTFVLWDETKNERLNQDAMVEFSKGKLFYRYGEPEKAIRSLEAAQKMEFSEQRKVSIIAYLSMIYKSREEWDKAIACWQSMIDSSTPFYLLPYVELAKYYEHRIKDFHRAKMVVEMAISKIAPYRTLELNALEYRLNRLNRRIAKCEEFQ